MAKGIPPKPKECKCWVNYPNPSRKERCQYYECIKEMEWYPNKHKTVCKLKEQKNET